ncbi:MAG: DUF2493 domain-containing protein [Desulfobacteraceae bacterium]|nr:DUF2493 domain-containing protein [Desulfobacteraceae bacterium]
MKIIVAGSRDFSDYRLMKTKLDHLLQNQKDATIVSGGARGADTLAIQYAKENGLEIVVINAEWDTYGRSAGYRRNERMAEESDALVAFWDGRSRGTAHMIEIAKNRNLKTRVVRF